MNHVHRLVDRSRGAVVGSLELVLEAAPVSGSSPLVEEKGEELRGVLTMGESGRRVQGVWPAAGSSGSG
jgi:hypothetical protein